MAADPGTAVSCPVCFDTQVTQWVHTTERCRHALCLGCAERTRMSSFVRKPNTAPDVFTFCTNMRCAMCRDHMPSFNTPLAPVGGHRVEWRDNQCPLCGHRAPSTSDLLRHMVFGCVERYPECIFCNQKLTADDNPPEFAAAGRKASMTKHWRHHLLHGCNKVPCTGCWRQGTWEEVQKCQALHPTFENLAGVARSMIEAASARGGRVETNVAADIYARIRAWQRLLFAVDPPPGQEDGYGVPMEGGVMPHPAGPRPGTIPRVRRIRRRRRRSAYQAEETDDPDDTDPVEPVDSEAEAEPGGVGVPIHDERVYHPVPQRAPLARVCELPSASGRCPPTPEAQAIERQ